MTDSRSGRGRAASIRVQQIRSEQDLDVSGRCRRHNRAGDQRRVQDWGWQIGSERSGREDAERGQQRDANAVRGCVQWIAPDASEPGAKGGEREADGPNRRV